MYQFSFYNPVRSHVGRGKYKEIATLAKGSRVFLMSDPIISKMPYFEECKALLGSRCVAIFTEVAPNPECDTVNAAIKIAKDSNADCIVAIGGGSTLDCGKAVAAMVKSTEPAEAYVNGSAKLDKGRLELILCPTTAGTGSEVTNVAVITDTKIFKKTALVSDYFYGDIAVIDPSLTATMPRKVAASSGFDAMCHAVECYWNKVATPVSDSIALYAMKLICNNLTQACDGNDDAREEMVVASYMAGMAFNQTRTTICHAASYYLTARFGIDHGTACTFTLIPFLKFNCKDPAVKAKFDVVGAFCGVKDSDGFIKKLEEMYDYLELPKHLSQYKVEEKDLKDITQECVNVGSSKLNACDASYDDVYAILKEIL